MDVKRNIFKSGGLFGRGVRERVICALAHCDGPVHQAQIVRALKTSQTAVARAVSHFEVSGFVHVLRSSPARSYIALDAGHPCAKQFRALCRALGPATPGLAPDAAHRHGLRADRDPWKPVGDLFVSDTAGRILVAVATMGAADATDLAALFGADEAGVLYSARRLVAAGILARTIEWKHKPLSINPEFKAAAELHDLLIAISRRSGRRAFVEMSARKEGGLRGPQPPEKPRIPPRRRPLTVAASRLPIGHPAFVKLLLVTAVGGAVTARELSKAVRISGPGCRRNARVLVGLGLLVEGKVSAPHGGRELIWSLNRKHALYTPLEHAIRRAAAFAGYTCESPRKHLPAATRSTRFIDDYQMRRLLLGDVASGTVTAAAVAARCGVPMRRLRHRLAVLASSGLAKVASESRGVVIHPKPPATELRALLEAIAATSGPRVKRQRK